MWEALDKAAYYRLGNVTAIVDVNRLGQRGPTELEWDMDAYRRRVEAFGCAAAVIDGHDPAQIDAVLGVARQAPRPTVVLAKTVKGKGFAEIENKNGWPVLYPGGESFPVGGCKVLRTGPGDEVTLIGAGVTVHQCLRAADELAAGGIAARVIDLYSVKPLDQATLAAAAEATGGGGWLSPRTITLRAASAVPCWRRSPEPGSRCGPGSARCAACPAPGHQPS